MTQDAASRAADKIWADTVKVPFPDARQKSVDADAAIIRAEYAELVEACKAVLKNDDADSFDVLIKALKAVEGV